MKGEEKRANKKDKSKIFLKNFKGQVTIFIIIAIIIVALAILLYIFLSKPKTDIIPGTKNPPVYIQECMQEKIENTVDILSLQGGSVNPEGYYIYENNKVEYLCYINEYYRPCVVQQPMLTQHIQKEILNEIEDETVSCFDSMKDNYEQKGYEVSMKTGNTTVELLPNKIITTFGYEVVLIKGETEKYQNFRIALNNDLYKLASIANSIIQWETLYGDAETTIYMDYYHDLKVNKQKQIEGTTIYILTDINNDKIFQFASRSYAFPPGILI
ncbi:MAG: hypothetical protein ABIE36_03365 [Candidatus Diapherotrites archaeon]